ncbi:MAG TPA: hypothetical protein VLA34_09775, partial [Candidatus Krumholzibacterium sp.]|nr:hypothetical protein [Candidatus Krumholzibacterium sp.]
RDLVFGGRDSGDLLLIQGPLMLNWARRRKGMLPGIENGDVSLANPITEERIRLWIDAGVSVRGREDIVFVKVHTHGVKPKNTPALLGPPTSDGMSLLETRFNDGSDHRLFYVSAREMANVAFALNDGVERPVEELFDYRLVLERAVSRR